MTAAEGLPMLLALALGAAGGIGVSSELRYRRIQRNIDRAYARLAHRKCGMTTREIAVELGRPAHQVRRWLESDVRDRKVA